MDQEGPQQNQKPIILKQQPLEEQSSLTSSQQALRQELTIMGFEPDLINQALKSANNLDQAIELIADGFEQKDLLVDGPHLFLLVRMDLNMGLGKIAAQCAHAVLKAFQQGRRRAGQDPDYSMTFIEWLERGQKQLVYRVADEQQLFALIGNANFKGYPSVCIRDAGRTQVAAGSVTVGSIGPVMSEKAASLVGHLKPL